MDVFHFSLALGAGKTSGVIFLHCSFPRKINVRVQKGSPTCRRGGGNKLCRAQKPEEMPSHPCHRPHGRRPPRGRQSEGELHRGRGSGVGGLDGGGGGVPRDPEDGVVVPLRLERLVGHRPLGPQHVLRGREVAADAVNN